MSWVIIVLVVWGVIALFTAAADRKNKRGGWFPKD
jgi:hypothetical protein